MGYPNMSYCMMENTELALQQVLTAMAEALDNGPAAVREFFQDMSREERQSYQSLFDACQDFLRRAEELEEAREAVDIE